jgi:hypothetical protein
MGSLEMVDKLGFQTCVELMGHPSMGKNIEHDFAIITF